LILFLALGQTISSVRAQYVEPLKINRTNAYKMLEIENYQEAIRQFSQLLNEDPDNANFKLGLAKAYNYSPIDHAKGLQILIELNKDLKRPLGSFFELGIAFHKNYRFDEAIEVFKELKIALKDPEKIEFMQSWIDRSVRAKLMVQNPVEVKLENLGEDVNSEAPDFLPFVEPDESTIYFTTKREGVVGNLFDYSGYRTADVFTTRHRFNEYERARSIGSPNTYGNELTAGRSENGEFMVYQINSEEHFSDLFISEKGRKAYMPPKELDSEEANQKSSSEVSAAISNDGKRVYFSSDRQGGMGGFDIWVIKKLPIGIWSEPQNIGAPINTKGDEKYPFLRGDEGLIYFSSDGHPGMGGMDLFVALQDKESRTWQAPENMGYPINTTDDDLSICYAAHSRYAYIGSNRKDSYGDLDIYRLVFEEVRPEYTLISGMVMNPDSSLLGKKVLIEVFDSKDGSLYGSYIMNQKTGRYHAILPPGDYVMEIHDIYGHKDFLKKIIVAGKNEFVARRQLDIILDEDQSENQPEMDTRIERKVFK